MRKKLSSRIASERGYRIFDGKPYRVWGEWYRTKGFADHEAQQLRLGLGWAVRVVTLHPILYGKRAVRYQLYFRR